MTNRFNREMALDKLITSATGHEWKGCAELCFKILYGLPVKLQQECAVLMAERYLPLFEAHRPKSSAWARGLIASPIIWIKQKGRAIPSLRGKMHVADSSFITVLDSLLLAFQNSDDKLKLTSACASVITESIGARMVNVWEADDPEAVRLWKASMNSADSAFLAVVRNELKHRTVFRNAASLAVASREWKHLVEGFRGRAVYIYEALPTDEIDRAFIIWEKNELHPITRSNS